MHILGMLRWLVICMSRPVQNHLDSYKMYNQILQCLLILLINFILYLNINLKHILKMFTPRPPPPPQKVLQNHFQVICPWTPLYAPVRPCTPLYAPVRSCTPNVSKHDLLEEPGAGACHIIFREFRYLSMHILLGMIRWLVRGMSRPVHNHLPIVIKYTINI